MHTQGNKSFIQYLSLLLTSEKMQMNIVLEIVDKINHSMQSSNECVTIMQQIFLNEPSKKILFTVELLEYLVKNCNRNFHQAANNQSFQKAILKLLRRQRGKFTLVEKMRSNIDNWVQIEAKILYIIQLWYDTFILEEGSYNHIIDNYKLLRKENIIFPPRRVEQKNMMAVKTQSPIFEHITQISNIDQQKFRKKKIALGIQKSSIGQQKNSKRQDLMRQFQQKPKDQRNPQKTEINKPTVLDLQQLQNLIAVIRSLDHQTYFTNQPYEKLKKMLANQSKPKQNEKLYNEIVKEAEKVIIEWENKYKKSKIIEEEEYMKKKLGKLKIQKSQQKVVVQGNSSLNSKTKIEDIDLLG